MQVVASGDTSLPKAQGIVSVTEAATKIYPLNDEIGCIELVTAAGSDLMVVNAARVSLGKHSKVMNSADAKLIDYLITHDHGTPFEHNMLTFRIKLPLFVARHFMRHRVGVSFNEISARYAELPHEFYIPHELRCQSKSNKQASTDVQVENAAVLREIYVDACRKSYEAYQQMLKAGVCREQARALLPTAIYTEFYFTCNARSLIHFLNLRLGEGAQKETRAYAEALLRLSEPHFPVTFAAYRKKNKLPVQSTAASSNLASSSTSNSSSSATQSSEGNK